MTMHQRYGLLVSLLLLGPACLAQQTWKIEAEAPEVTRQAGVQVVPDAEASGGQAVEMPAEGIPAWNDVGVSLPPGPTPGRYVLRVVLKYDNALNLGRACQILIASGQGDYFTHAMAYPLYLRSPQGYSSFEMPLVWLTRQPVPAIWLRWSGEGGKPSVRLDYFEIVRTGDLPALLVTRVRPNKIRYREGEAGTVAVTVRNTTVREQTGELVVGLRHDLEPETSLGKQTVTVPPEGQQSATVSLPRLTGQFGYAVRAEVTSGGKVADSGEDTFCVHNDPYAVWAGNEDVNRSSYQMPWQWLPTGAGFTDAEIAQGVALAREQYTTCHEVFSWSPGEALGLAPDKPCWIRANGGYSLVSKRELQQFVSGLRAEGIGVVSYVAFQAMGEEALSLYRQRPGWFTYNGSHADMAEWYDTAELQRQRDFWKAFDWEGYRKHGDPGAPGWTGSDDDWKHYKEFWAKPVEQVRPMRTIGYWDVNYRWPEVIDYCAQQVIASTKMFGWDGLRWDCGHLNTGSLWGTYYSFPDFYGQPLAKTPEEMVQQTITNLQRFKQQVRAACPGFVFGANYGSWQETHRFPEMTKELCRDGGWLLDEIACDYQRASSPYHWWDKYYAIMCDEGEFVTSQGGHYFPFAPNRQGCKYEADRLYDTVFRLVGHGHPFSPYYNSCLPMGNYAQFAVRFGRFLFDPAMRRLEPGASVVRVEASRPIWWEKSVRRLTDGKSEYRIIHLINPPVTTELETNPEGRMPEPVNEVAVSVKMPEGKQKARAWLLTAESGRFGEPPLTRAIPLEVKPGDWPSVTVPQVLYWKTVVFRFE